MGLKEIRELLGEDWDRTMALIREAVSSDIALLQETNEGILAHGGKMMRPMLSLLFASACSQGKLSEESLHIAAAAELLHNATLLHDDVADCSAERRGVPTVSATLGESASVLVGDFWLVKAMRMVVDLEDYHKELVDLFSKTLQDLAEGEMFQLQKACMGDTGREDYFRIIYCKTGSLFETACRSGAVSVSASAQQEEAARLYGEKIGLAFQVRDDILDYVGDESLGKPIGSDLKEQKITLPLLGALDRVDDGKKKAIRRMVCGIPDNPGNCGKILEFVREYDGVAYAESCLKGLVDEALGALAPIPDCPQKEALVSLARFTADRTA